MLREIRTFCQNCGKPFMVCLCCTVAGIGFAKVDPLAKQLPARAHQTALTALATGTAGPGAHLVVHNEVTGQRITAMWPDQRGQPALGPTGPGPAGDNWRPKVVSTTGPTGAYAGSSGREFPKGPTGATG
jgi:hypothetical protein